MVRKRSTPCAINGFMLVILWCLFFGTRVTGKSMGTRKGTAISAKLVTMVPVNVRGHGDEREGCLLCGAY